MNKLVNFRDLGGTPTACGKKVKAGLLFRSGHLHDLSLEEVANLEGLGLRAIIDFRTTKEIDDAPNVIIPNAEYTNINIFTKPTKVFIAWSDWIKNINGQNAEANMFELYEHFVRDEDTRAAFGGFLHLLADIDGSALFHCFAGKDRTGFAAALLLRILGVSMDDILEDYMQTVKEREVTNAADLEALKAEGLSQDQLEGIAIAYTVKEAYLQNTFNIINQQYGSFDAFVENGLGIKKDLIEVLKDKYLG
ncbi:MAG: tyrosine-protein phosphatase [Defluviitaleaceae bacterium]|nr:tyrosine-protein phosphatase [Defluviitaleaceae bacterium]